MKPGPKAVPDKLKEARGTFQKSRSKGEIKVPEAMRLPMMPNYLPPAAQAIWVEEFDRVVASQVSELDSSHFARYCALEAQVRETFKAGELPPAAYLVELRRLAETMGLAGAGSRVGAPVAATASAPFADLVRGIESKQ